MNGGSSAADLQIGQLLGEAWEIFKNNVGLLLGGGVVMWLILMAANYLTFGIGGLVINGPLMLGYMAIVLACVRRRPADFNMLFSGFQRFLPAFLANLIISIFTGIGLILCVIPGIIVSFMYAFTYCFMNDRQDDFWPLMEASRLKFMADFGKWVVIMLALVGINIVGAIPCGLGLLVTLPLSLIVIGLAYDKTEGGAAPASGMGTATASDPFAPPPDAPQG